MAKGTWVDAGPDDPIYTGKFVISSKKSRQGSMTSTGTSTTDPTGQGAPSSTPTTGGAGQTQHSFRNFVRFVVTTVRNIPKGVGNE